jgi:hypothetical protein
MPYSWDSFLWTADEWIINYSLPPGTLGAVNLFSVGHALELYLKACYTKFTGNIDAAIRFGHNVSEIWFACKKLEKDFLHTHELRRSILEQDLLRTADVEQLPREDLLHFLANQELYIICKYLPDLKYLGAPLKKLTGAFGMATASRNPAWAILFHDLRSYLGHPREGRIDIIRYYIEEGELPYGSVYFLKQVLGG